MSEPKTRRIRITHDGSLNVAGGSKVVDAETGEMIKWVSRVEIVLDAREGIHAIIHVIPEVDVILDAEERPFFVGENAK